jgi:Uma2 family endonuclease
MTRPLERPRHFTVTEYLRIEHDATDKHEFRDGEIIAMSGGTVIHSQITANVGGALWSRLRGSPCRVYDSNLRVRIKRRQLYSYPDVTVICERPEVDPDDPSGETVTNPRVVVEVLSPSTERYNRTKKFDRYRELDSFREYVLVSQDTARVETFYRQNDGTWALDVADGLGTSIRFRAIEITLPLAEIYAGVELPPEPPEPNGVV